MKFLTPGTYQHYKGGFYRVLGAAVDVTQDEHTFKVVYLGVSDENKSHPMLYVRDYDDFTGWVDKNTGETVPEPTYEDSVTSAIPRFEHVPHLG